MTDVMLYTPSSKKRNEVIKMLTSIYSKSFIHFTLRYGNECIDLIPSEQYNMIQCSGLSYAKKEGFIILNLIPKQNESQ